MANEIHGSKAFNVVAAALIDFGVEEGVSHDILVSSYAIWGTNAFHLQEDGTADVTSHLLPANTYVSHTIPCRTLSVFGGGGATGTVYWKAIPMLGVTQMSDLEAQTHRGGIDC